MRDSFLPGLLILATNLTFWKGGAFAPPKMVWNFLPALQGGYAFFGCTFMVLCFGCQLPDFRKYWRNACMYACIANLGEFQNMAILSPRQCTMHMTYLSLGAT